MSAVKPAPTSAPAITIDIALECSAWAGYENELREHINYLASELFCPQSAGELSLLLGDDTRLAALNKKYRDKQGATNILSFPASDGLDIADKNTYLLLGDIALSFERVEEEANAAGISFSARALHLLTHGVLHLIGYTHSNEKDAQIMEALEIKLLAARGIANPYEIMEAGDER